MKDQSQKSNHIYLYAGALFSLVGVALALLLSCKHGFPGLCSLSLGCTINGTDGCGALGGIGISKILGLPIAFYGLFYYTTLLFLFLRFILNQGKPMVRSSIELLSSLVFFGVVLDAILGSVNFCLLKPFGISCPPVPCMLCVYSYFATAGVAISTYLLHRSLAKEATPAESLNDNIKQALIPGGAALVLTVVLLFSLSIAGGSGQNRESAATGGSARLLAPTMVETVLTDFNGLKGTTLNEKGLIDVEGPDSAYITIHKFADFRCPHCYDAGEILKEAMDRWPGRIRIFYRHFPLDGVCNNLVERKSEGWSCNGAQAAICAGELGKGPDFYHAIFELQRLPGNQMHEISIDMLKTINESLDGDWGKMMNCMGSAATQKKIDRDVQDAQAIGVQSTPTIVVNGKTLPPGTPDREVFLNTLDALVYQKEGEGAYREFEARQAAKSSQQNTTK